MRVLHVVPGLDARTGGVATGVVQLCVGLESVGVSTTVMSTDLCGPASAPAKRSVRQADLPDGAGSLDIRLFRSSRPRRLAASRELREVLLRESPSYDVVHIHSLWLAPQLAAYRAAVRARRPWIVSLEGSLDPWLQQRGRVRKKAADLLWQRRMLAGASALHLTTTAEADLTRDVVPHVPRAIVPYPIDYGAQQEPGSAQRFRERFLPGRTGPVVMHLGRVAEKKGIDILIRAFRAVRDSVPDAQLVVVGPDDERLTPRLLSLARELAVEDSVTFTGMVRGSARRDALAAADVWVLASHTENFGIAVIEALAAGRPVVVSSKVNGADEIGRAGAARLVEPAWPAVAAAVGELLGDASQRADLGRRGRRFAARFTREAVAVRARGMYESVLRNGRVESSGEAGR